MNLSANDVIELIKKYLFDFDYEKFYGKIKYNKKEYFASNLLYSLLLSERLGLDFEYIEDISVANFRNKFQEAVLKYGSDPEKRTEFVLLLKEILDISDQIARMNGITFSFHEILTNKVNLDDLKEKVHTMLDDDMRKCIPLFNEFEDEVVKRFNNANSPLSKLINSKARGNAKQLGQQFLAVGYKVDNSSNILKKPILESLSDGIKDKDAFFVQAIGCRNAIIQGTNFVSSSGYLNRKLSFGSIDIDLSKENDCKTDTYLNILITNQNKNIVLNGRYIEEDGNIKLINSSAVNNYVGKKVNLRSPVTCKCKDGICKTCYGILSQVNRGLSIGLLAATFLAEIITQKLLSTKHLLFAAIVKDNPWIMQYIEFNHKEDEIRCIKPFKMYRNHLDKIIFKDDGTEEEFDHNFKNLLFDGKELKEIEDEIEFKIGDIVFTGIQNYVNKDTNALMKKINMVFEKTNEMKEINDYNVYIEHMIDLLLQMGNIPSIHVEIILSLMCKQADNHSKMWRLDQSKDLEIISIRKSNLSNSLFSNILFERVKESLLDLDSYLDKDNSVTKYEKLFNGTNNEAEAYL